MDPFSTLLERLDQKYLAASLDLRETNPLVLAYVGDTVYHLYIRTMLCFESCGKTVNRLHRESVSHAKASAQARIAREIAEMLSDEERDILRRGRNAKSGTIPKNARIADYKLATGFEALIGYLYLLRKMDRMTQILDRAAEIIRGENKEEKEPDEQGT